MFLIRQSSACIGTAQLTSSRFMSWTSVVLSRAARPQKAHTIFPCIRLWMFLKPNETKNWRLKSCKGLELTYKTAKRTETDVQNFPPCAAILASLFDRANDWELAFQIWKLSSLLRLDSAQLINQTLSMPIRRVQIRNECGTASELDFHIWNANWPMKCEAKMAAYGGQFCTSISVPFAGLYVSFSLPHFLHFLKIS